MLVEKDGKQIEVTEKAYASVYAGHGFRPVKAPGTEPFTVTSTTKVDNLTVDTLGSFTELSDPSGRLTAEELAAVMKNKGTVTAKLQALGVEFEDDAHSGDLKALLESELAARDLLPE